MYCWSERCLYLPCYLQSLQGTNSFHTTTVSSSYFYNSQVSSRAQTPGSPATQDYAQQRQQQLPQQQQQQQTVNQAAYSSSQATTTTTTQPSLRAKIGGPRQYPGYPQSGMQQYYSSAATASTGQQQLQTQPGQSQQWAGTQNAQPTGNFYNPMDYSTPNPVASQPAPTQGLSGYPSQPSQPAPTQGLSGYPSQPSQPTPMAPTTYPTPPEHAPVTSQGIEARELKDGWNDPPILKPKPVRNITIIYFGKVPGRNKKKKQQLITTR